MSEWREEGSALVRDFEFADFGTAIILIHGWNKVRLTLSTHSAGALTQPDHDLAAGIDGLGVG